MALFFLSPEKCYLIPIAIQLFQEKGNDNPVSNNFKYWGKSVKEKEKKEKEVGRLISYRFCKERKRNKKKNGDSLHNSLYSFQNGRKIVTFCSKYI